MLIASSHPGDCVVIEKIFEHAHATPDKIAIFDRGHTISYGQFAFWISCARQFLSRQDLRPGSVAVLLSIPCRLDAWAMDFALRSLGMHTISVGELEELEELRLRNVGCVITTIKDCPIPIDPGAGYKLLLIPEPFYFGKAAGPVPEFPELMHPEGGHIFLTSGSTGAKKKVLIGADSLSIMAERRCDVFGISENSILNVFGFAMWSGIGYKQPLSAWGKGGAVIFHQGSDPHRSLMIDGITHAALTPQQLSVVLKAPAAELRRNPNMRLSVGGAPMSRPCAEATRALLTPHIFASISSTEIGLWALTRIDSPEDLVSHQIHPSVEVQVVDEADSPLPVGRMGAVRIRENGVTGYFDDDEASRAFFRHGYFYPGDLGMFQADGRLVLGGRITNVINVQGNKIAAEPIEQALQDRLVADGVCVFSMPGKEAEEELHVVIQSSRPIGEAEVMLAINSKLSGSGYAVVSFVKSIPRNDMGKIDRAALKQQISAARAGKLT